SSGSTAGATGAGFGQPARTTRDSSTGRPPGRRVTASVARAGARIGEREAALHPGPACIQPAAHVLDLPVERAGLRLPPGPGRVAARGGLLELVPEPVEDRVARRLRQLVRQDCVEPR